MKRITNTFVSIICALSFLTAQENNSKNNINWGEFTPTIKFDGFLKSKFEYADETNTSRFSVRNSRVGITGDITSFVSYRAMAELSSEGKFNVLDLYGAINPLEGLTVKLGQSSIPIHNPYTVSPGKLLFANRAFIGKYFTPGTRDIGVSSSYDFSIADFPIGVDAGLFNGNTINDPVWTNTLSYSTRLRVGNMKGFRTTAKLYKYPKSEEINFMFYGFDLRYEANNWKVETEVMHRKNKMDNDKLIATYLQGAYWFPLQNGKLFRNMITAARWDAMGSNQTNSDIDLNRLTMGVGFSFTPVPFESLIRIDYEFYFSKNELPMWNRQEEETSNKLTVELLLTF
ncbi:MAG: hypothetical protein PHO84_00560 [Dysgonamonadaceae bacterium]|jgi:hypothetical protein|nr:hypothetical protein [Dysgonamonadaceae bacterium]MDD3727023.1 hypothetical protein [Dysgonamonadaceae bacterium]MDD4245629.1 hypothetical protein [Dysgonamonadaceae bacterium]MDD4604774.1 hypothetical protein [Dysgonamonadaceae bacterium]HUI32968.1 hypothetical protein [Dysgonamonadaceae bacterium]